MLLMPHEVLFTVCLHAASMMSVPDLLYPKVCKLLNIKFSQAGILNVGIRFAAQTRILAHASELAREILTTYTCIYLIVLCGI